MSAFHHPRRLPLLALALALLGVSLCGCEAKQSPDETAEGRLRYGSGAPSGHYGGEALTVGAADMPAAPAAVREDAPAAGPRVAPRAGPVSGYRVAAGGVEGGATVRGRVRLSQAPAGYAENAKSWQVAFNRDQQKCGHEEHITERVVFDAQNLTLANCVVYLVGIEEGKEWSEALKAKDRTALIDQVKCLYQPHVQALRSKTQLQVRNSDTAEHNIKGLLNGSTVFNLLQSAGGFIADSGDTYLKRLGRYVLNCDVHPWMSGHIHVFDHPYFVVTNSDGAFEFTDVPPGEWQIVCWHEGMQEVAQYSSTGISGYMYGEDFEETRPIKVAAGSSQEIEFVIPAPTR